MEEAWALGLLTRMEGDWNEAIMRDSRARVGNVYARDGKFPDGVKTTRHRDGVGNVGTVSKRPRRR